MHMKRLIMFALLAVAAAGCSSEADTSSYDASEYTTSLPSNTGEEVEIFTEERADLYFYFTGVT